MRKIASIGMSLSVNVIFNTDSVVLEVLRNSHEFSTAIASDVGSTVILALVPGLYPSAAVHGALAGKLSAYALRKGVPFLGLDSALGDPARADLFLPRDPLHPNTTGHKLIAETIVPLIPF